MAWNKPSGAAQPEPKAPSKGRGIFALIAVVALGGLVAWWLWPKEETRQDAASTNRGLIKEVKPAAAPKALEVVEKPKEIPYWEKDTTNGLTFRQLMKWKIHHRPPAAYTNRSSQTEAPPAYAIFEHQCDNAMAAMLTMPPGATAVGDPGYERWFTQDFLKSLETPIIVTKDDTPEQAQLKRDLIQVKIDLKARYDAGEDIAEIMSQTRREMQQLSIYKNEIEASFREMVHKPGLTDEDYEDCLKAANMMLDQKGIAPLKPGPLAKRRILRSVNKINKEN